MRDEADGHPLLELLSMGSVWVRDARGTRVRLYRCNSGIPVDHQLRAAARKTIGAGGNIRLGLSLIFVLIVAWTIRKNVVAFLLSGFQSTNSLLPMLIIVSPAMTCLFAWSAVRKDHGLKMARAFVAVGNCASCGYSLDHISKELDGCTVCPECGAVWRLRMQPDTSEIGRLINRRLEKSDAGSKAFGIGLGASFVFFMTWIFWFLEDGVPHPLLFTAAIGVGLALGWVSVNYGTLYFTRRPRALTTAIDRLIGNWDGADGPVKMPPDQPPDLPRPRP